MKTIRVLLGVAALLLFLVLIQGAIAAETYVYETQWNHASTPMDWLQNDQGVALDASGNVYVADTSHNRIVKFTADGEYIAQWSTLGTPTDLAIDSAGNIYVSENNINQIEKFDPSGTSVKKWGGPGSAEGKFNGPNGVGLDAAGNVYVADFGNKRIQKFDSDGNFLVAWNPGGSGHPDDVAIDAANYIYVIDGGGGGGSSAVLKFDSGRNFIKTWALLGDGERGIAVDSTDNLYIAETHSMQVVKFTSDGTLVTTWGSSGSGNGNFNYPWGIAVNPAGTIVYVADNGNNRVQKFAKVPTTGNISITSTPPGALIGYCNMDTNPGCELTLGTQADQVTPYTISNIPAGTYSIFVVGGACGEQRSGIVLHPGETLDLSYSFHPSCYTGQLYVTSSSGGSEIDGAEIFIDGGDTGQVTPAYINMVSPGSHLIDVTKSGYDEPAGKIVTVSMGLRTTVDFTLTKSGTTGSIHITSSPPGAEIWINGADTGQVTPATFAGKTPGNYLVTVINSSYVTPAARTVTVTAGQETDVNFALDEGSLYVTSVPDGAEIIIDGVDTGKTTDWTIDNVPEGKHTVTVSKAGYITPDEKTVTVTGMLQTEVDFTLDPVPPTTGVLRITSDTEGAEIFVNSADTHEVTDHSFTGETPGSYDVYVTLSGYDMPATKTVTVTAGQETDVDFTLVKTPPATGVLKVTSDTKGAEIFINNADTHEVTDYSFTGETPGSYDVYVTLSGYDMPATKTVTVTAGKETDVDFTLVKTPPATGVLKVTSDTKGAEIFINNADTHEVTDYSFTGETPGSYDVYVTLSGYDMPAKKTVTVTAGQETDVDFMLVKTPPSPTTGSIEVTAYPSGTQIWLDGVSQGYYYTGQVVTITGVSPGTHLIYGSYHDYANAPSIYWYQSSDPHVTVNAGQTTKYMLEMYIATPGWPGSVGVGAKCPVDLTITNPSGKVISKTADEIPGAIYTQPNLDADGFRDVLVAFQDEIPGYYHVKVTPKTGALSADTYTLTVQSGQKTVTLADKVPVSGISEKGYVFLLSADGSITIVPGDIPTPEFPSVALPVLFCICFLGAAAYIRSTREN